MCIDERVIAKYKIQSSKFRKIENIEKNNIVIIIFHKKRKITWVVYSDNISMFKKVMVTITMTGRLINTIEQNYMPSTLLYVSHASFSLILKTVL